MKYFTMFILFFCLFISACSPKPKEDTDPTLIEVTPSPIIETIVETVVVTSPPLVTIIAETVEVTVPPIIETVPPVIETVVETVEVTSPPKVATVIVTSPPEIESQEYESYEHPEFSNTFLYPSDWEFGEEAGSIFFGPEPDNVNQHDFALIFYTEISISNFSSSNPITILQEYNEIWLDSIDYQPRTEVEAININEYQGAQSNGLIIIESDEETVYFVTVLSRENIEMVSIFYGMMTLDYVDKYLPTYNTMVNSLHSKQTPETPVAAHSIYTNFSEEINRYRGINGQNLLNVRNNELNELALKRLQLLHTLDLVNGSGMPPLPQAEIPDPYVVLEAPFAIDRSISNIYFSRPEDALDTLIDWHGTDYILNPTWTDVSAYYLCTESRCGYIVIMGKRVE